MAGQLVPAPLVVAQLGRPPFDSDFVSAPPDGTLVLDPASGSYVRYQGNWWVTGIGAGVELARAETTVPYTLTASFVAIPNLTVPVLITPGMQVHVECECPWVLSGTTIPNFVALRLMEDGNQLKTSIQSIVQIVGALNTGVATDNLARVSTSYTPTPGIHIYSVQAEVQSAATASTIEAGNVAGNIVTPYLRVVTC